MGKGQRVLFRIGRGQQLAQVKSQINSLFLHLEDQFARQLPQDIHDRRTARGCASRKIAEWRARRTAKRASSVDGGRRGGPNETTDLQVSAGIVRDKQQTPARRYHVLSLYLETFLPGGHFYLSFWEPNRVAASDGTRSPTLENTNDRARAFREYRARRKNRKKREKIGKK